MLNPPLARLDADLPPGARVLLVGQAAVFHLNHPIVYNTVFDHETFETLARGRTPAEVGQALQRAGHHPRLRRLVRDRALPLAGQLRVHPVRHSRGLRRARGRGRARTGPGDRGAAGALSGTLIQSAEVSSTDSREAAVSDGTAGYALQIADSSSSRSPEGWASPRPHPTLPRVAHQGRRRSRTPWHDVREPWRPVIDP